MAAVLFFMWWNERKERQATQVKFEKFLEEHADRLLNFAEEYRAAMNNNTNEMTNLKSSVNALLQQPRG